MYHVITYGGSSVQHYYMAQSAVTSIVKVILLSLGATWANTAFWWFLEAVSASMLLQLRSSSTGSDAMQASKMRGHIFRQT